MSERVDEADDESVAIRAADSPLVRGMAYFLFQLGYPYDVTVRDSDNDPVTPPLAVLDALIDEWREHEVKPDTDETRDDYRASFAIEIGTDPWEGRSVTTTRAMLAQAAEALEAVG